MAQTCRVLCITVLCQALFPVYKDKSGLGDFQQSDTETRLMSDKIDNVLYACVLNHPCLPWIYTEFSGLKNVKDYRTLILTFWREYDKLGKLSFWMTSSHDVHMWIHQRIFPTPNMLNTYSTVTMLNSVHNVLTHLHQKEYLNPMQQSL